MIPIFKKNLNRIEKRKIITIMFLVMVAGSIGFTLYMDQNQKAAITVAYVGNDSTMIQNPSLKIINVDEEPPLSDLVINKYDAIVNENLEFKSIKNEEFNEQLLFLIRGLNIESNGHNIGVSIVKMMTMFLFMQCGTLLFVLGDDLELHIVERIVKAPVRLVEYLLGNIIFVAMFSTVISWIVLLVYQILGFDLGFSLSYYFAILLLINFIATSISSCFYVLFKKVDSAVMFSQVFTVITSLLSGSFNLMENNESWLSSFTKVLPQKIIYSGLESINSTSKYGWYAMIWIIVTLIISWSLLKKSYE